MILQVPQRWSSSSTNSVIGGIYSLLFLTSEPSSPRKCPGGGCANTASSVMHATPLGVTFIRGQALVTPKVQVATTALSFSQKGVVVARGESIRHRSGMTDIGFWKSHLLASSSCCTLNPCTTRATDSLFWKRAFSQKLQFQRRPHTFSGMSFVRCDEKVC